MRPVVILTVLLIAPEAVSAHPAPYSYVDLRLGPARVDGTLVVHDFDVAHDFGIDPPERLRDVTVASEYRQKLSALMASRMALLVDSSPIELTWTDFETLPDRQSLRLGFRVTTTNPGRLQLHANLFPYDPGHQTFVNVYENGALRHQAILAGTRQTTEYYAGTWQGTRAVVAVFVPAGIEHILIGPDHVLFLIGLLLLGGSMWRLATIVTAFTIGHSITLTLAALDVVSPPANIIEPAIALSIIFVGADNLLVQKDTAVAAAARDIRPWVAAIFGLVHGFGFAFVLKEFGLPLEALGWSLFSFNAGVEVGQLLIVLVVASVINAIRGRSPRAARHLVWAGSVVVIAAGAYWFIERVFLTRGA
jgi:hydrogenase/urease accessory protein HupE